MVDNANWTTHETHIGWEEVPLTSVCKDTILETLLEDWLENYSQKGHKHTTSEVTDWLNKVYPVGSIYMSVNSTSPASLFGGTWVQLKDRFLLGAGDTYSNGATDGESTHTLTTNEMPSHTHSPPTWVHYASSGGNTGGYNLPTVSNNKGNTYVQASPQVNKDVSYTGGGQAHNNMPPYLVVYMWKRTR